VTLTVICDEINKNDEYKRFIVFIFTEPLSLFCKKLRSWSLLLNTAFPLDFMQPLQENQQLVFLAEKAIVNLAGSDGPYYEKSNSKPWSQDVYETTRHTRRLGECCASFNMIALFDARNFDMTIPHDIGVLLTLLLSPQSI
jgi:hypothetical protein